MARQTQQQTTALNILDWLLFNQTLVYCVFSDEDRSWLYKIYERVNAADAATGQTGVNAEIMKHYILCYLEILASDEGANDYPDVETYKKVMRYNKVFFSSIVMASANAQVSRKSASDSAFIIAQELCDDFLVAPVAVRFRLVEPCMVLEYPNAARDALVWLAEIQVLSCAKYREGTIAHEKHETVVSRVGLLCEFELAQINIRRLKSKDEDKPRRIAETMFDNIVDKLQSPLERILVEQAGKLWSEKLYGIEPPEIPILAFLVDRAFDKDYVTQFLNQVSTLWRRHRLFEGTSAAWAGIIGALNLAVTKFNDNAKPLYQSIKNVSTASDEANKSLFRHGLKIKAKTLYLRYRHSDQFIRPRIADYYTSLQSSARVITSEDEDIWYFILCTTPYQQSMESNPS